MPIYEYRCANGHTFEVIQRMSDDPVSACEICGTADIERVYHPVAIHFKGSGFHNTDYGKRKRSAGEDGGSSDGAAKDGGADKATAGDTAAASSSSAGEGTAKAGSGDGG